MRFLIILLSLIALPSLATEYRIGQTVCITAEGYDDYTVTAEHCSQYEVDGNKTITYTFREMAAVRGGYSVDQVEVLDVQFMYDDGYFNPSAAIVIYRVDKSIPHEPPREDCSVYCFPEKKPYDNHTEY